MAIASIDDYLAAPKQTVTLARTLSRTAVAAQWFTTLDLAGNPGAGVLAGTNTASGVCPTGQDTGFPLLNTFSAEAVGYLTQVDFGSSVACRMKLHDLLFKAGAYAFNANVTLAGQPDYTARVPEGAYADTVLFFEAVTAFTGNPTVNIQYTNWQGVAGRSSGNFALGSAPIIGRLYQIPLQAGDSGVSKIEKVTCTVATAGTFNILVTRPLWSGRVRTNNDGATHGLDMTAMPLVTQDSALMLAVAPDSTATGVPELEFVIANG